MLVQLTDFLDIVLDGKHNPCTDFVVLAPCTLKSSNSVAAHKINFVVYTVLVLRTAPTRNLTIAAHPEASGQLTTIPSHTSTRTSTKTPIKKSEKNLAVSAPVLLATLRTCKVGSAPEARIQEVSRYFNDKDGALRNSGKKSMIYNVLFVLVRTDDIEYSLHYYLCHYICITLNTACEVYIPLGSDGKGMLRFKDHDAERQRGRGAKNEGFEPRDLSVADKENVHYMDICVLAATGEFLY